MRVILILVVVIISIFTPVSGNVAYGKESPYVKIEEDIYLMDRETSEDIFLLPESYYAPIETMDESYYYITFNGVKGKVDRSSVSAVGYNGEVKGTMQEVLIDTKYSIFTEIKLKTKLFSDENIVVPVDASMVYLGEYVANKEKYYYIKYNELFGYINAEYTTNPSITIPVFVPEVEKEKPTVTKSTTPVEKDNEIVRIIIITSLCVVFLILIFIIFKPVKGKKDRYYYEE